MEEDLLRCHRIQKFPYDRVPNWSYAQSYGAADDSVVEASSSRRAPRAGEERDAESRAALQLDRALVSKIPGFYARRLV